MLSKGITNFIKIKTMHYKGRKFYKWEIRRNGKIAFPKSEHSYMA